MSNPIIERIKHFYIYVIVWLIISVLQTLLILLASDLEFYVALTDSLVFNVLFALLAITVWYPIRYGNPEGKISIGIVLTYIIVGVVILTGWLYLGYMILRMILVNHQEYFAFLNDSLV